MGGARRMPAELPPFLSKGQRSTGVHASQTPSSRGLTRTRWTSSQRPLASFLDLEGYSYATGSCPGRHIRVHYFRREGQTVWGLTAAEADSRLRSRSVASARHATPIPGGMDIQSIRTDARGREDGGTGVVPRRVRGVIVKTRKTRARAASDVRTRQSYKASVGFWLRSRVDSLSVPSHPPALTIRGVHGLAGGGIDLAHPNTLPLEPAGRQSDPGHGLTCTPPELGILVVHLHRAGDADIIAHGAVVEEPPVPGPRSAASKSPLSRLAAATATLTSSLA